MAKLTQLPTKSPALEVSDILYGVRPADGVNGDFNFSVQDLDDLLFVPHKTDTANPHSVTYTQIGADQAGAAQNVQNNLDTHEADTGNPHSVTAAQAGADPLGSADGVQSNLDAHIADTNNPHSVTYVQAGADPDGAAQAVHDKFDAFIGIIEQLPLNNGFPTDIYTFDRTECWAIQLLLVVRNSVSGVDEFWILDIMPQETGTDVFITATVTNDPNTDDAGFVFEGTISGDDVTVSVTAPSSNWSAVAARLNMNAA